jgi:DNA-binding transcriptional LysR family regulator
MHGAHLSAIDLNLLPLLDALLAERHVTRAGRRVVLSQPAASRGLGRLRDLLGDPLLVRTGLATTLTPRAEALREPVRRALGAVGDVLAPPAPFDPAHLVRTVRIACDDYGALVVLAPGVARLTRAAPGLDVRVTVAERIARSFGAHLPVAIFEPPLPLPGFTLGLYSHRRGGGDPALAWIRDELTAAARASSTVIASSSPTFLPPMR